MITFLTFREDQIIGGTIPNLIGSGLFLGAIGYFALTGKMARDVRLGKQKLISSIENQCTRGTNE